MKLLKRELEALVEIAELEGWEDSAQFCTALAARLDEVRGERLCHYAVTTTAGIGSVVGPFATSNQARKAIEKSGLGSGWVIPGRTPEGHGKHLVEIAEPAVTKGDFAVVQEDARLFRAGWNGKSSTRGAW